VSPLGIRSTPADQVPLASLDFETTGLHIDSGHRVVEVGVVRLDPVTGVRRAYSTLVNPGVPIIRRSQAIHGISDEMVADAPRFGEVLPRLAPLVEGAVFIAHNANFDLNFLRAESRWAKATAPEPAAVIDTLALARHVFRLPSCSLSAVAARIGLPFHGAHRALADARAALAVYQAMVQSISPEGVPTVGALIDTIQAAARNRGSEDVRSQLEAAVIRGEPIVIDYTSYQGNGELVTRRRITVLKVNRRRVDAFCHLRDARRTFRLDRIRNVQLVK